jgi:hypothetical protein
MLKKIFTFFLVSVAVLFYSCQNEKVQQQQSTVVTITKTTPLTSYLERLVMQKTSQDNMIDKSSYCTIKLPYVVKVNSITIPVNSTADYQKVLDNINFYSNDNDVVSIGFPVTMIYYNHAEKILNNQSDFDTLLSYWSYQPDILSKINCLYINYPIKINTYNTDRQIANSASFNNDKSLFGFLNNLNQNQLIALSYPISVTNTATNEAIAINDNNQFEKVIQLAIENCVENPSNNLDFSKIITTSPWKIVYAYHDSDKTTVFNGYSFDFKADNTVTATKNSTTQNGTWSIKINNGVREFRVKFNLDPLKELDEDWTVFEFNSSKLRFSKKEAIESETSYLYFDKI